MRRLGIYKIIILIAVTIAAIITVAAIVTLSIFAIGVRTKNNITEIAKEQGYEIEFEDTFHFCITEDNVEYYYESKLGNAQLQEIYTKVPSKTERKVVNNEGEITITVMGRGRYRVALEDGVISEGYQGKETVFNEHIHFICSSEFTKESIDPKSITARMAKAEKYYNKITTNFVSTEELCNLYEQGEAFAHELNGR